MWPNNFTQHALCGSAPRTSSLRAYLPVDALRAIIPLANIAKCGTLAEITIAKNIMTIIFAGHFTVGEKLNKTQLKCVEAAKKINGDLAVLVNDIDFKRKLQFFEIGGKEMVIRHYGSRKKCGTTAPLCELPEYDELPNLIDWNFYEMALAKIKESKLKIDEVLRKEIIPQAIKQRLADYKIDAKIFTERELRNVASIRLSNSRRNGAKSWIPLLKKTKILKDVKANISKIPVCGAIMLALYEKISEAGYISLVQLYAEEDKKAIENGTSLCATLHHHFPEDKRWGLKIKNQYF